MSHMHFVHIYLLMVPFCFDLAKGGSQRRAPVGGSAKGIPRNCATVGCAVSIKPWTNPDVVSAFKHVVA